ncbi:MAG: hypothetical protein ING91_19285 [Rhodocyclaceae bacterium]|nr:hypothetical protein [Rhodocyclaceae bacterium]MCA3116378.1 hypothetical protein [Rhodocyclaceae bacterium]
MKIAPLMLIFALSAPAQAEFMTGNQLYGDMLSRDPVRIATAQGYLMGVFDAYQHTAHCAPGTVNLRQVWDVSLRMLETAATLRHEAADQLVVAVLKVAWPCATRPTPNRGSGA